MTGSLWTRFWKTESVGDSLDHNMDEKPPNQEDTDVGPGGLSFEEGASVQSFCSSSWFNILHRYCRGARPSPWRHLVHANRRRMYHWYRHLLDTFLDSERRRLHRGVTHALGAGIRPFVLWVVHLARIWDHVSAEWWRKGLFGGYLSEAEIPCYGGVCGECNLAWVRGEWMHRKTDEMLRVCLANFGYIGICEQVSDLVDYSAQVFQRRYSILVSAGAVATNWSERGIALTSACP